MLRAAILVDRSSLASSPILRRGTLLVHVSLLALRALGSDAPPRGIMLLAVRHPHVAHRHERADAPIGASALEWVSDAGQPKRPET
ncbi:hypothetical protein GCM10009777_33660 [Microbacterium pumilum]|uniref:Uncharacterized protein n=1 Tax=Microbacterium pumilum TaxID=344165 RepID=A0ABN2SYS2_9MICO